MGRITVLVLVVLLVAAACSSDNSGEAGSIGTDEPGIASEVRVVSQNLLHGVSCPPESNKCELAERVELFTRQLAADGCPELVGIQEANSEVVELIETSTAEICDGDYEIVWDQNEGIDREVVLTTLPVLGSARRRLAGPLRTAFWVRVASGVGVVDFISTHLASTSDDRPCSEDICPEPCTLEDTLNACQARQTVAFAEEMALEESVVILGGDLNAAPGEPTNEIIAAAGFTDSHLEAGSPECNPDTGAQCTSGRDSTSIAVLQDPTSINTERIDFLWWGGERACESVPPTGLFNSEAATDGPGGLAYPSDHTGVQVTLECNTTEKQRDAAGSATVPDTTTTTAGENANADAEAAITEAFEAFFDGAEADLSIRLSYLENASELQGAVEETFGRNAEVAARSTGRVDSIRITGPTTAEVTYSVLLDGQVALDGVLGDAVEIDGRWLVGQDTFCTIATQGSPSLPAACR